MSSFPQFRPISELLCLSSKRAVVTGGARGIGLAISYRLAEAGASVIIADMDATTAEQSCRHFTETAGKAIPAICDVSLEEDIMTLMALAVDRMGGIDILVNNAGVYPRKSLADVTASDLDKVMSVNLRGTFLCSREASLQMIKQNTGGCIINITSVDAVHPSQKGLAAYDASKGAVQTLTKSLALELAQYDIRVNSIAPGGILTEGVLSMDGNSSAGQGKSQLKTLLACMPLGRMGRPDDVAGVALFLASCLADYITGASIVVDGGYLIS